MLQGNASFWHSSSFTGSISFQSMTSFIQEEMFSCGTEDLFWDLGEFVSICKVAHVRTELDKPCFSGVGRKAKNYLSSWFTAVPAWWWWEIMEGTQESSTHFKTEVLKWEFLLRRGNECGRRKKFFMQTVANVHFCQGLSGLYSALANTTITTNLTRLIKCLELWVWWAKHALWGEKWHWAYSVGFVADRNCEKQKLTSQ